MIGYMKGNEDYFDWFAETSDAPGAADLLAGGRSPDGASADDPGVAAAAPGVPAPGSTFTGAPVSIARVVAPATLLRRSCFARSSAIALAVVSCSLSLASHCRFMTGSTIFT